MITILSILFTYVGLVTNSSQLQDKTDSVYIKKSYYNKKAHGYDSLSLVYKTGEKNYIIHKCYGIEVELRFDYFYKDTLKSYQSYIIGNIPDGSYQNIFFDEKSKAFYMTDPYNLSAGNDRIVRKSVSFDKKSARVKSEGSDGKYFYYTIKLKKIW
jgi:hypothetical protein